MKPADVIPCSRSFGNFCAVCWAASLYHPAILTRTGWCPSGAGPKVAVARQSLSRTKTPISTFHQESNKILLRVFFQQKKFSLCPCDSVANLTIDELLLRRALDLARSGVGLTSPNPNVGAVIVDRAGNVVGTGAYT